MLPHRKKHRFCCMFPNETQVLQQLAVLVVCHGLAAGQVTSRYFFFQRPMIWLEAQRFCQSHYVDLAVLSTEEEYFNLLDAIPATNSFWLGLQRQGFSRAWKWVSGEELSYKHWFKMNNEGLCASLEAMLATEEKLLGRLCDELHMIVCQGPVSPQSVTVDSVSSSHVILRWNISAFMQMTPHSYNITICHCDCKTFFYYYNSSSSFMSVNIFNLTAATEYFIQISAVVVPLKSVSNGKTILQDNPAIVQVKTDSKPRKIILLKLLRLVFLAPPLWILYRLLKKDAFTDEIQGRFSAQDTAADLFC
ncbi:uncharacterized protein LOC112450392 [Kryptolebias marmoratus]|uniref:uncharacterized protein LOC112450392 n=1 Tax=Kryptolebias marmoratus TaxID=37003 RepID=UPI000D52F5C2|nr:uncharacterized protein LOC112450392 [Kryptolebias marmoratus]